jgi:hypothetical protein
MTAVRSIALLALIASPALAASSWSTPAGSQTGYSYSNGQNANGYFGSPITTSDSFVFSPSQFSAEAAGSSQTTSDTASTLLTANSGRSFKSVSASLAGDYSVFGIPSGPITALVAPTSVSAMGTLTLTNTATHVVLSQPFNFGGLTNEDGIFSDKVTINLPAGWKSVQVDLSGTVSATADQSSTAFIQFKSATLSADTQQVAAVPLPPALLAAIPGAIVAFSAARRMRRA